MYATVGCHPTRCNEFLADPDLYYNSLLDLVRENKSQVYLIITNLLVWLISILNIIIYFPNFYCNSNQLKD